MKTVMIEDQLSEPEEMSLCPLCDNVITDGEPVVIGEAYGCLALVHECCVD